MSRRQEHSTKNVFSCHSSSNVSRKPPSLNRASTAKEIVENQERKNFEELTSA
jgi:hypothetical protein